MAASNPRPIPARSLLAVAAAALLLCAVARAVSPADDVQLGDTAIHRVSPAHFAADLQHLRSVVAACAAQADACNASLVPDDERIGDGAASFEMHWSWLRSALHTSHDAKLPDRDRLMRESEAQLASMAQELGVTANDPGFSSARSAAQQVLNTPEFDQNAGPTWLDRKRAQLFELISSLFDGLGQLGTQAPWIGIALESLLFIAAAVGIVIFLLRSLARQRRRIALSASGAMQTAWQREATDWARMAEQNAAAADWREAVHCLYWAAIVLLEGRRAWRHNPTRTPREYVRLLKPGSAQQQGLRGLTLIFERVWYGHRDATAEDYARAQTFFQMLDRPEAAATTATSTAAGAPA